MPFKVVVIGSYGRASQAAEEWEKSCANKFNWFRTPYAEFLKDSEGGDDSKTYHEFLTAEVQEFRLLAEEFIKLYGQELKDYLKMLCESYGPHVAFETFNECVKKYNLTSLTLYRWRFKIADMIWSWRNHTQSFFQRKKHESYSDYCLRKSPIYRRIYDINRQLDEWDKQTKKGYGF